MMTIAQLLALVTPAQTRTAAVNTLVGLGVPANQWAAGGTWSTILTYTTNVIAWLQNQIVNIISLFFLPTAVSQAIATGDTGNLQLLATYAYGVTVPQATFASGPITLTNSSGSIYSVTPYQLTAYDAANGQSYQNTTAFTLGALSSATAPFQCTQAGSVGSANPGDVNALATPLLGVTCTNAASLVGIDSPSALTIQELCLSSLGARSVRGPRSAYAYAILTATNAVTGNPVNINRFTITTASHTGDVQVVICGPSGTTDPNDLAGVKASIEGLQGNPLTGARPDGVTVTTLAASTVPYTATVTPYVLAPKGASSAALQAAIAMQIANFFSSQGTNPIGGVTASDDTSTGVTGVFASGVYGAVAQGVASIAGCALISCRGGIDLALTELQVATDNVTVNPPVITVMSN